MKIQTIEQFDELWQRSRKAYTEHLKEKIEKGEPLDIIDTNAAKQRGLIK